MKRFLKRLKDYVLFGAYPGQFTVGAFEGATPVVTTGPSGGTGGPGFVPSTGGVSPTATVPPGGGIVAQAPPPAAAGLTPAQIAQINAQVAAQANAAAIAAYNAEVAAYLAKASAAVVPSQTARPAAPPAPAGHSFSQQVGLLPGPSAFTPFNISIAQGQAFAARERALRGQPGRPIVPPPPPHLPPPPPPIFGHPPPPPIMPPPPPIAPPPDLIVPGQIPTNPTFPSPSIVGGIQRSTMCGSGLSFDSSSGGCVPNGLLGTIQRGLEAVNTELPKVAGELIGAQFGGPAGAFIGREIGGQIGQVVNRLPPSYQRYLESQRTAPTTGPPIESQPPPNMNPKVFQVGQFCLDCAPSVKTRLQQQCPDCTPDDLTRIVSQCNEDLSCTPEGMELRAQKLQTEKQITTEKGQATRQEIAQQRSQLQQFKQQEQFPIQSQQQIQRSIQQKEQLLQQIEQELEDLSNQQEALNEAPSASQTTQQTMTPQRAGSVPAQGQQPAPQVPAVWEPPAPQRLKVGGIEPYIFCVACETPHDANLFLNGENAACSIMPPGPETANLQPTL